jgi:hypothetical protein
MSAEMESDDEVQEIDPMVIIWCGRKKYRKKILKEELDFHFCRCSKRHNNNVESCQDQDGIVLHVGIYPLSKSFPSLVNLSQFLGKIN